MEKVDIKTRDGVCPSTVFRQTGNGPWPAALLFMDGIGIRPAILEMGERLSTNGYLVLVPDLFYRAGPYEPMDPHVVFSDPEERKRLMARFSQANAANVMEDTRAFLDYLSSRKDVVPGAVGVTGYCFGGLMALTAAGTYPDRIAAAASYHGPRLATDAPESPHWLAPKMKAKIYVGAAIDDPTFTDEMKTRLEDALTKANVDHRIETYQARHGWVPRDTPVHDPAATERHWQTLLCLFDDGLKPAFATR